MSHVVLAPGTAVDFNPAFPDPDSDFTVTWSDRNDGTADSGAYTDHLHFVNDSADKVAHPAPDHTEDVSCDDLPHGQSAQRTCTLRLPEAAYLITVETPSGTFDGGRVIVGQAP
jgi:hypothetical protein